MGNSVRKVANEVLQRCGAVTVFIALILMGGCNWGPIAERTVSISGKVIENGTQAPVDSAWLAIGDSVLAPVFYSDAQGQFALASYPLTVPKPIFAGKSGYQTTVVDTLESFSHDISGLLIELEKAE